MADTTALKNRIRAAIKANDNQEITGPVLQQSLLDIVDELNGATEYEAGRRQSGDSTLSGMINSETQRAQGVEQNLSQAIGAEAQRAQEAERGLGQNFTNISNLISNLLNSGFVYAGIAVPTTNPGTPEVPVFYIAVQPGTYTNFGNKQIKGTQYDFCILKWADNSWNLTGTNVGEFAKNYIPKRMNLGMYINNDGSVAPYNKFNMTELIHVPFDNSTQVIIRGGYPSGTISCIQQYDKDLKHIGYIVCDNTTEFVVTKSSFLQDAAYFLVQSNIENYGSFEVEINNVNAGKLDRKLLTGLTVYSSKMQEAIDNISSNIFDDIEFEDITGAQTENLSIILRKEIGEDEGQPLYLDIATLNLGPATANKSGLMTAQEKANLAELQEDMSLLFTKGQNLFNKNAEGILDGKWIDYNSGNLGDDVSMLVSDYISVTAGQTYVVRAATGFYGTTNGKNVGFYDSNKENYQRLPGILKNNNQYIEFTAPGNGYVRFSIYVADKDTAMMLKGTTYPSEYEPYGITINLPEIEQMQEDIEELQEDMSLLFTKGQNLFNKNAEGILDGKWIDYNNSGILGDNASLLTSDYIAVESGQKYVVKSAVGFYGATNGKNVAYYDSNKENYQRVPGILKNNNQYIEFTAPGNGYVRFSIYVADKDTAMMLKGTTYPSEYEPYGIVINLPEIEQMQEDIEYLKQDVKNPVYGKRILWLGDSIGEAASAGEGVGGTQRYGWSGRIADIYHGTFYSLARSGNTITKNVATGVGSILTKLEELYTNSHTGQYLIIEGGTNDADRIGSILNNNTPEKFGTWDKNDYSGNYDEETFCGAVDSLFYKALTHYKGVKIGFLIAQKMGAFSGTPKVNNYVTMENRRAYFDVIKEMCKKWGIPCLDMWDNAWLNPDLVNHYDTSKDAAGNTEAGSYYTDGQHLTAAAYDYLATVIGKWIETL